MFVTDRNIPTATVRFSGALLLLQIVSPSYFQTLLLLQMKDSGVLLPLLLLLLLPL